MIDPLFPKGDGHTEVPHDDRVGLLPTYISTLEELFEAEHRNISLALVRRTPTTTTLLDDKYLRDLHRSMFNEVWDWAGQYRTRQTNIGIEPPQIAVAVRLLVQDARSWVDHATYPDDEIGVRFHHRLVAIHPFRNGNGRHGRIAADYLMKSVSGQTFSWGSAMASDTEILRRTYRQALQQADRGDIEPLLKFARD